MPAGMAANELAIAQNAASFEAMQTQAVVGPFNIVRSQRNPTGLFGAGLIDAIPDRAIEAAAKTKYFSFPEIAGRVSRLKDKRIGRFGWKAQTPTLDDFVLTACAVELGLEVPGHHQGGSPQKPAQGAKGLDLNSDECGALVAYVREIPRPAARKPATDQEAAEVAAGRALFTKAGCVSCHTPKLGDVEGLYSDLLLHDMGEQLGDTGQYGVFDPSSSDDEVIDEVGPVAGATAPSDRDPFALDAPQPGAALAPLPPSTVPVPPSAPSDLAAVDTPVQINQVVALPPALLAPAVPVQATALFSGPNGLVTFADGPFQLPFHLGPSGKRPTTGPASRFEWRTPPLWGFRDSGPYLHDGRARTLDQAVALHGGEATRVAQRFFKLSAGERRQVEAFLKSLTAPSQHELLASAAK